MKYKYIIAAVVVTGLIMGGMVVLSAPVTQVGGASYAACTTTTETTVAVGDDISTNVLSATSGRSYARIQLVTNTLGVATNTPSIAFGATATLANGLQLSTSTPFVEFGMDTDHPYSGAVSAITDVGSTTLRVTECR